MKLKRKDEKEIVEGFKKKFIEIHSAGLLQGSKAMCKCVLDKVNNENLSAEERLKDIKRFCEVSLSLKK